jgi:hypothetical protein
LSSVGIEAIRYYAMVDEAVVNEASRLIASHVASKNTDIKAGVQGTENKLG